MMEYMESKMQDYIEAGISEADRCYTRIAELEEQNAALAAQLDESRELHAATLNRLYEIFNVDGSDGEIRSKWALLAADQCKTERDALAAQVEELLVHGTALATAASMATGAMAIGSPVTEFCVEAVKRFNAAKAVTPQNHLAQIRAEAGRAGYLEGAKEWCFNTEICITDIEKSAERHHASIRQEVE